MEMMLRRMALSSRDALTRALLWQGTRRASGTAVSERHPSPVDVENFTLNEEVVKKDMEALQQWNELSHVMDAFRAERKYDKILDSVEKGLAMLQEMGPLNAPIQCETLLLLEAAQAHYNLQNFETALSKAYMVEKALLAVPPDTRDAARLAEARHLIAFILLKSGKTDEANRVFTEVLRWIDVDSKAAMPMQAVAAVNMRRLIVTGIGLCYQQLAEKEVASGGDGKELYGKGLDLLIDALDSHIDESDYESVKSTLSSVLKCFEGVGDISQAVSTSEKYISWCRRHNDADGVANGTLWLKDLKERYGVGDTGVTGG